MATASVTNEFVDATTAEAADVNTNFADLVTFLNDSAIHRDGSKAFTGAQAMGSNKITGLAAATANGDAVRYNEFNTSDALHANPDITGGQQTVANAGNGLTTSFGDEASVTFTMPGSWSTALVIAWGSLGMETGDSGVEIEARIGIGASDGTAAPSGTGGASFEQSVGASHSTTVSGTSLIALQGKCSSGSQDRSHAMIAYIAIRLT